MPAAVSTTGVDVMPLGSMLPHCSALRGTGGPRLVRHLTAPSSALSAYNQLCSVPVMIADPATDGSAWTSPSSRAGPVRWARPTTGAAGPMPVRAALPMYVVQFSAGLAATVVVVGAAVVVVAASVVVVESRVVVGRA